MSDDFESLSIPQIKNLIEETHAILKKATERFNGKVGEKKEVEFKLAEIVKRYQDVKQEKDDLEAALKRMKPLIDEKREELNRYRHWLRRAELLAQERELFAQLSEELDLLTSTATWREKAKDHQIEGAKRMALTGGKAILGDKRGLGKSLTSLITLDMLQAKFNSGRKVIIIAPKETIRNFDKEIKRWASHRRLVSIIGMERKKREFLLESLPFIDQWVLTVNLEAWRKDSYFIDKLIELQADTVIIDEAHSIKDPDSVAATGVKRLVHATNMCQLCGGKELRYGDNNLVCQTEGCPGVYKLDDPLCMSVKHVIPMTGTLILNTPDDLWMLLHLIDPESFSEKNFFLHEYCEYLGGGRYSFKPGGEEALVKKLGPQLIQRDRKTAGIKIPPQEIQFHNIDFDGVSHKHQYRAYRELQEKFMIFSNKEPDKIMQVNQDHVLTHILRSRQMITWPMGIIWKDPLTKEVIFQCDVEESIKMDYAINLIKELREEGERVVVFSQFKEPLKELNRRLAQETTKAFGGQYIKPVLLDGDTSPYMRARIADDFDRAYVQTPQWDVVMANYKVAGQSLNFTDATQMVILDEEWNPGRNDQAYGRIDRMGQTEETTVHVLQALPSIDSFMRDINERKEKIIKGFEGEIHLFDELRRAIENGDV